MARLLLLMVSGYWFLTCSLCRSASYYDPKPLPPNEFGIGFHERHAYEVGTDPIAFAQFARDRTIRVALLKDVSA
jgi:hypothetical protein